MSIVCGAVRATALGQKSNCSDLCKNSSLIFCNSWYKKDLLPSVWWHHNTLAASSYTQFVTSYLGDLPFNNYLLQFAMKTYSLQKSYGIAITCHWAVWDKFWLQIQLRHVSITQSCNFQTIWSTFIFFKFFIWWCSLCSNCNCNYNCFQSNSNCTHVQKAVHHSVMTGYFT